MNHSLNAVVFITGTFISNNCWDEWIAYFENEGYHCLAPAWPYKETSAEELRNRPAGDLIATNTIFSLTDHFAGIISGLPVKPILIGHSLGGLIVQLLLQREMASAGIAVHSFPPRGISWSRFSFVKAMMEAMMLCTSPRETYLISFPKWKYAIANGMSWEQQKQSYYNFAVPESKTIIRDTFRCLVKIDFKKPHAPLLLTSGSCDKLIPAALNYSNYKKYATGNSITDYKQFKGHNHLAFAGTAGKREADFILYWLQGIHQ